MILTALILLLTPSCTDDRAAWTPTPEAHHYEVTLNDTPSVSTQLSFYPVGCTPTSTQVCVTAVDLAGNRSHPVCMDWQAIELEPRMEIDGPCAVGCLENLPCTDGLYCAPALCFGCPTWNAIP